MRNKGLIVVRVCILLFAAVGVCGQDREKLRTPLPIESEPIVDRQPPIDIAPSLQQPPAPCQSAMTLLYESVAQHLNDGKELSTEQIISAARNAVGPDAEIVVIRLNDKPQPDMFVGYSCNVDVSETFATFRVFRSNTAGYVVAARSEDYPILSNRTGEGLQIDQSSLDAVAIHVPGSSNQSSYVSTIWTQGGGRPAPVSVIVWRWDGDGLQAIWQKLELRNGVAKVVPPLIVVSTANAKSATTDNVIYRLESDRVVNDGALSVRLLERYKAANLLISQSPEDLANVGYLWEVVGQPQRAVDAYEQAVLKDTNGKSSYLYLTIADIYERTGKPSQSAKTLRAYQKAAKGDLSTTTNKTLDERIQRLQRSAPDQ